MFQETVPQVERKRLFEQQFINVEIAVKLAFYFAPLQPGSSQRRYGGPLGEVTELGELHQKFHSQSNKLLNPNDQLRADELQKKFLTELGISQDIINDFNQLIVDVANQDQDIDPHQAWLNFFNKHKPAKSDLGPHDPDQLISYIEKNTGQPITSDQPEIAQAA